MCKREKYTEPNKRYKKEYPTFSSFVFLDYLIRKDPVYMPFLRYIINLERRVAGLKFKKSETCLEFFKSNDIKNFGFFFLEYKIIPCVAYLLYPVMRFVSFFFNVLLIKFFSSLLRFCGFIFYDLKYVQNYGGICLRPSRVYPKGILRKRKCYVFQEFFDIFHIVWLIFCYCCVQLRKKLKRFTILMLKAEILQLSRIYAFYETGQDRFLKLRYM